jgi:hypothetical protein
VRACDTGMNDSRANFGNKKKASFSKFSVFQSFGYFSSIVCVFRLSSSAFKFSLQCFTPLFHLCFIKHSRLRLVPSILSYNSSRLVNLRSMSYYYPYITWSLLSHSVVRNITLLPLPPLLTLPLRLLLLLLLLLPPLSRLLLLDSLAFGYLRHPLLDIHLHILGSIVYCSNSCSFAATDSLLFSASPSPSSLCFQIIFFSGLQQCLRFYVELVYGLAGASALERGLLS